MVLLLKHKTPPKQFVTRTYLFAYLQDKSMAPKSFTKVMVTSSDFLQKNVSGNHIPPMISMIKKAYMAWTS